MQKVIFTLFTCLVTLAGFSQNFVDSFETYANGAYLGVSSPVWTTWSNNPGSAEDVLITNADAHSGTQSIYFASSSANGGPQDVVLPFSPTALVTGQFTFELWMKVEANKGAYFNFQADPVVGTTWALDAYFVQNGDLILGSNQQTVLTTTYPNNVWFKLTLDLNLNTNNWELLVDGVSKGTFASNVNQVAALDLFPVNGTGVGGNNQSGFYVDDVNIDYVPYTLTTRNGAVINISSGLKLAGQNSAPTVTVRNLGSQPITSFDLTVDYNGNQVVENVTGVNIPSLGTYDVEFSQTLLAVAGSNSLTATISNVNGQGNDLDPADDSKSVTIDPVVPTPGKVILAEEATGTWCQWCPRGTVAMWKMAKDYPEFFAGIAVHNNDPMVVQAYDSEIGNYIGGYPSALVNRQPEIDPSAIEESFLQLIAQPVTAQVSNSATYSGTTNVLNVDMRIEFEQPSNGNWNVVMVLTEDSVSGSASGYAQANAYSFQLSNLPLVGAGKDWQQEPATVPASQMSYDHVARVLDPSFQGRSGVIPSSVNAGDTFHTSFSATLDPSWDMDKMHIITFLIGPNGEVDNTGESDVKDAKNITATSPCVCGPALTVYPSPATDVLHVQFNPEKITGPSIKLINLQGQVIGTKVLASGYSIVDFEVQDLARGIYLLQYQVGEKVVIDKVVIQ